MSKILFIASSVYYKCDGYRTRIDLEIEKLKELHEVSLFLPQVDKDINFPAGIRIIKYPTNYKMKFHYVYNNAKFYSSLNIFLEKEHPVVIAESLIPAIKSYKLSKKNKCKFVFDCHGTEPSEFRLNNPGIKGKILYYLLSFLEKKVVKNSDLVVTVTKKQFDFFNVKNNNVVFPMMPTSEFLVDETFRDEIRGMIGIKSHEIVYVYSGQNQKWQMCEETCDLFKKIQSKDRNARLLILTGCKEYFKNLVEKKGINNAIIMTVPHHDVPKYLDACDFGFCIRNSSIINRFASPTKVLEYVSRNVVPILSPYVGDFSELLVEKQLAYVVEGEELPDFVRSNCCGRRFVDSMTKQKVNEYINAINSMEI